MADRRDAVFVDVETQPPRASIVTHVSSEKRRWKFLAIKIFLAYNVFRTVQPPYFAILYIANLPYSRYPHVPQIPPQMKKQALVMGIYHQEH